MPKAAVVDPVPPTALPKFSPVTSPAPVMPPVWTATVLLHPFSPPPSSNPTPDNPFFQLCTAQLDYYAGELFSARVTGLRYGQWWYMMTPTETQVSNNGGITWRKIDMGWSLPTDWYGARANTARCPGASPLNWMSDTPAEWWTIEAPVIPPPPPPPPGQLPTVAATWLWFDPLTKAPLRMMFGNCPPKPTKGDPTQLAFLQMFSFSYFTRFDGFAPEDAPPKPDTWITASVPGLVPGNPRGYQPFVWNGNMGLTAFMTPVNGRYNPLPTRVLYKWTADWAYRQRTDRSQNTLMNYNFNTNQPPGSKPIAVQTALLTGPAPQGMPPPPDSGTGFLYWTNTDGSQQCVSGGQFQYGQEPPNWVSIPAVEGTIEATIVNNPVLGPGQVITIWSVLFPPAPPNYKEATYLWTWYVPQNASGTVARPVTFMQSQSQVNQGTSLALADYYYHHLFSKPIDPANFAIPDCCQSGS